MYLLIDIALHDYPLMDVHGVQPHTKNKILENTLSRSVDDATNTRQKEEVSFSCIIVSSEPPITSWKCCLWSHAAKSVPCKILAAHMHHMDNASCELCSTIVSIPEVNKLKKHYFDRHSIICDNVRHELALLYMPMYN